jgi:hypothetical protein
VSQGNIVASVKFIADISELLPKLISGSDILLLQLFFATGPALTKLV